MIARLALALALLLVVAEPARADAPVAWQHRALAIAQVVWHPDCGQLHLRFAQPPADVASMDPEGWASSGDCGLALNVSHHWHYFPPFCHAVLHEAGHAAGVGHSDNPRSVMYPRMVLDHGHAVGSRRMVWPGLDRRCTTSTRTLVPRVRRPPAQPRVRCRTTPTTGEFVGVTLISITFGHKYRCRADTDRRDGLL